MHIFRVSELAQDNPIVKEKLPGGVHHAAFLGNQIHADLTPKYVKEGGTAGTTQVLFLSTARSNNIGGIITGTPDIGRVNGKQLFIVDFKTTKSGETKSKSWGQNQLLLYAFQGVMNNPGKVNDIVMENGLFGRELEDAQTMTIREMFGSQLSVEEVIEKATDYLRRRLQKRVNIHPFQAGRIELGEKINDRLSS